MEVEANAVDLLCLFCRMGDTEEEGGAFPNSQYNGRGEDEGAREKAREREKQKGRERE